jgi:hypothetical protein
LVLADYLQKFWIRLANILQKSVQHSGILLQNLFLLLKFFLKILPKIWLAFYFLKNVGNCQLIMVGLLHGTCLSLIAVLHETF